MSSRSSNRSKTARKAVRRSISLSGDISTKIDTLARQQRRSANQIIEGLVAAGLEAREMEKQRFFEAAERFRAASDPDETKQAKEVLAKMIFGS